MSDKMYKQKGFTLVELLVVISIIALLSSVVLASVNQAREKARVAKAQQELGQIYNALQLYMNNNNGKAPREGEPAYGRTQQWNAPDCRNNFDHGGYNESDLNGKYDRPNAQYVDVFSSYLEEYLDPIPKDPLG